MKTDFYRTLLILTLLLPAFFVAARAQNAAPEAPAQTEIMGENDRLPFMQTDPARERDETSSGGLLVKTIGAMLLIVGLIFAGAWGARKLGFGHTTIENAADELNLTVTKSIALGGGRTISTVRFGDKVLLIGSTAQSFTLLAEEEGFRESALLPTRSVAEMLDEESAPFAEQFEKARTRLDDGGRIL